MRFFGRLLLVVLALSAAPPSAASIPAANRCNALLPDESVHMWIRESVSRLPVSGPTTPSSDTRRLIDGAVATIDARFAPPSAVLDTNDVALDPTTLAPWTGELRLSLFATRAPSNVAPNRIRPTLWDLPDLYLVASDESRTQILTGFKAAPFVEPATGLAYFRARWYDPGTGTFLTPDPMGYQDSSALYAYCAGDPVNCSDPLGEWGWWDQNIDALDEEGWREFRGLLSGSIGTAPFFGEASDALQAVTGYDLIAGEKLAPWERGVAAASFLVPFGGARVARKSIGAAGDVVRGVDEVGEAAEHYLISSRRAERYRARLVRIMNDRNALIRNRTRRDVFKGGRRERYAELSGRIRMMGEGQLKLGSGKYTSIHGIDAIYYDYDPFLNSGFSSRSDYIAALGRAEARGKLSILESKYRRDFSLTGNPESLLGRGIKTEVDEEIVYLKQMSEGWIDEVTRRLRGSTVPGAFEMGEVLRLHKKAAGRYINVLNANGQTLLRRMP